MNKETEAVGWFMAETSDYWYGRAKEAVNRVIEDHNISDTDRKTILPIARNYLAETMADRMIKVFEQMDIPSSFIDLLVKAHYKVDYTTLAETWVDQYLRNRGNGEDS